MATVKTATANKAQLVKLATEILGLEVAADATVAALRVQIAAAGFDKTEFDLEGEDDGDGEKVAPRPTGAQIDAFDDERMVLIHIPHQEGVPGGSDAVPVGVNGNVARIMRGVDVKVPMKYVRVLQNANKHVFDKDENGTIVGFKEVPIYPFSILQAL